MARTKISEFSATPANNTDIDSINISEGCPPSSINDAIRELMSQLKDFQTGAVGDSFNGPVGASTASTGAFTTLSATGAITSTLATGTAPLVIASTTKVANLNVDLLDGADWAAPAALGSTTPAAVSATTLAASSTVTLSGGTANGVAYLNGSKVVTSGSALTFDGTRLTSTTGKFGGGAASNSASLMVNNATNTATGIQLFQDGIESWIMGMPANSAGLAWSASGSEQMRLTSTGLGIGTSSPAVKLESAGSSNGATLELLRINNTGSGANTAGQIVFRAAGTNYADIIGGYGASSARLSFNVAAGGYQSWAVAGSDKLTLDSSGNLGLGVTPSAWGSTWKAIQVGMGGSIFARTADQNRIGITANAFFDTAFKYIGTGQATFYDQDDGNHYWYNAPSGTAGNAITFTQAMSLLSGGDLVIGTTSTSITNGGIWLPPGGGSSSIQIGHASGTASGNTYANFGYSSNTIGSITQSGTTAVLYNVTSDQRLKENIVDAPEFGSVIDSIKVRSYDWKSDGSHQRAGFIAQELVTVAPEAVHQPEDSEQMMAVDYSKLVPMLVKEIQSLRKRLADAGL